ncbi:MULTISPECIES: LysR family transcriptional regulator [unclassified Pseudomonas]|uniref:LysR family transcriptional regulator n=1 Tax=unclassified Pseudomonas TaxID=196821 RepID=UPI00244828C8|nr:MULTISPECIES: LysR family transcriptional regulator [unclassified Pseudomonas]MDG9927720.1 LysR family transcriptional regulator [Pseudomonas sp. GD04042]MDH0483928.1 LysR family transcriptional regulator [Pseudomonas sp. GD04015]MDH0603952.1 LysR family transcriptional regulator [Pseudomonas sp. GD03869]
MLDALTLDQMRTFVTVADAGSFRAAASKLYRVQSGVSVAIGNLEAQLGVLLFDRSGHRPVLTAEGRVLLGNARDILLRVDAMRAKARGLGDGLELELPLAVDTLFPIQQVGVAIARMRSIYPSVTVRVVVEPLGGPLQALKEKRCTLSIMVGEDFRDPRITFEALSSVSQVVVVAAGHPLARQEAGQPIGVMELADHLQIVLSDPSRVSEGRDFGVISPQTCRVNTQDAKHALILAGVGWGRLPLWLVRRDLDEGRLLRLRTHSLGREGESVSEAYLAHRLDEPMGPAARALAEALVALNA